MENIDLFYEKLKADEILMEEFIQSLVDGTLLSFLEKQGVDPKISELSHLIDKIQEENTDLFEQISFEIEEDPAVDMPSEVLDDMVSPFQEEFIPPPEFLINYNAKFKGSQPILFRNEIIRQTLSCLILKNKSNVLLIGPAGVGKTKIAEEIACMLAENIPLIPPQLRGYTIWELPLSAVTAGSCFVGDIEKKTSRVIDFATNKNNKAILYIDEIHVLLSGDRSYGTIAQMLKPALARGNIRVIGATTLQEANNFMRDPAFNRRFNRIIVDELSKEQTKIILSEMNAELTEHYNGMITLGRKAIETAIEAADEYKIAGSHRPDNVITLIDRTMADVFVSRFEYVKNPIRVTPADVKRTALKLTTGSNHKDRIDIDSLRDKLSVIKGQEDVIDCIIDCVQRDSLELFPRKKPLTFLFAGSSGVGKTKTARILSQELTGSQPIILNMTEFTHESSINRIIGSPAGYIGSDSKAELPFDILESNPYQLILLDEFEKCHKSVQRLFMGVFDVGSLQLASGKLIDFSKAIIIATTNAGSATINNTIGFTSDETSAPSVTDLSHSFDIELLNRFTKILYFSPISEQLYRDILQERYARELAGIIRHGKANNCLPETIPDDVLDNLVRDSYNPAFGARPASRVVRAYIENLLLNEQKNLTTTEK